MLSRKRLRSTMAFVGWGVLLSLAYGQSPLYTSNQNQYFLHGLAQAGRGLLAEDWLANTADPTPVFSWLVLLTARYLPQAAFYIYYSLLFAVYLYSLRGIADQLYEVERRRTARWSFLALIFVSHSAAMRVLLGQGIGGEWQYLFDGGLAGQRLLGTVLQPSSFGVLLLLSVQQFLYDHPYRAVAAAALAAVVHPTHLLSAAVLTGAYMVVLIRDHRAPRLAFRVGALALALTLPLLIYSYLTFLPSAPDAQGILVHFRLPAHAVVSEWFGAASVTTLVLIGAALVLSRDSQLAPIVLISVVAGVGLTLVQIITASDALALLFPWRISTYLVPISTAVLTGWIAHWLAERLKRRFSRALQILSVLVIGLSVVSGLAWMAVQGVQRQIAPERALHDHVRQTRAPGQLYAIPSRLRDFRLETGVPVLADFKSIPYRRGEVINWHDRVRLLDWFYRAEIDCGLMQDFIGEYGVTHLVLGPDELGQSCAEMRERYNDGHYAIYELGPNS